MDSSEGQPDYGSQPLNHSANRGRSWILAAAVLSALLLAVVRLSDPHGPTTLVSSAEGLSTKGLSAQGLNAKELSAKGLSAKGLGLSAKENKELKDIGGLSGVWDLVRGAKGLKSAERPSAQGLSAKQLSAEKPSDKRPSAEGLSAEGLSAEGVKYHSPATDYYEGEKHILDIAFNRDQGYDQMVDEAYQEVEPGLEKRLEGELKAQMKRQIHEAILKYQKVHDISVLGTEMGKLKKGIEGQQNLMSYINNVASKVHDLENKVCGGGPCEDWPILYKRALQQRDASAKEKEYWKHLALVYEGIINATKAPPPPEHCQGLKEVMGAEGYITTGVGPAPDPLNNYCRWIIKAPAGESVITLRFSKMHLKGSDARISVFVGPENVELYKNEDVINWASAFKSFTGDVYPVPIVCHSSEVLVVFHTDKTVANEDHFDMTWQTGTDAAAKALLDDQLARTEHDHPGSDRLATQPLTAGGQPSTNTLASQAAKQAKK